MFFDYPNKNVRNRCRWMGVLYSLSEIDDPSGLAKQGIDYVTFLANTL